MKNSNKMKKFIKIGNKQIEISKIILEIKKEFLFDRTHNLLDALASIDYDGNKELKEFCLTYSKTI